MHTDLYRMFTRNEKKSFAIQWIESIRNTRLVFQTMKVTLSVSFLFPSFSETYSVGSARYYTIIFEVTQGQARKERRL